MNLLASALQVASIVVSVVLVILILLQVKGGAMGKMFGGDTGGIARTRRGLEKTLFQFTIGLAVAWLTISIFSVAFTQ